jgi:peptidylprolyl isomerase
MFASLLPLLFVQAAAAQAIGRTQPDPRSPTEILAAAPTSDWRQIAAEDMLVMELAGGRRVVVQLMPVTFARAWIGNIRTLATAEWWDGTSINRVQDNYVAQWGDASEKKPLPPGLSTSSEADYTVAATSLDQREITRGPADVYARATYFYRGWPIAGDEGWPNGGVQKGFVRGSRAWPVHCYGTVGVGRDVSPNTGTGAELYTVIGHAPRHLDRNIAVVGRVIAGIEHLSSLPRGTVGLGFYARPEQRVPIERLRLASALPVAERPRFEYLATNSPTWARYASARANRKDAFFIQPAGAADICNIPVPVRAIP